MDVWDPAEAQALVEEARWNQVPADWAIFRELGRVRTQRADDGSLAATAATLPYRGFGWISMVLVTARERRKGIATRLLEACIADLEDRGLVPGLDATPAGRAVYAPLGFVDGWAITRWRRTSGAAASGAALAAPESDGKIRSPSAADLAAVATLDAVAFGSPRPALLERLLERSAGFSCLHARGGAIDGFLLGRDGRTATQLGPLVADDEDVAIALLRHALGRTEGAVLIDVLDRHRRLATVLKEAGFVVERPYTRMIRGRELPFGDPRCTMAIAGPELG